MKSINHAFWLIAVNLLFLVVKPAFAFSGVWNYSWGDTVNSAVDIGTSVNRTCFLTGIGGNLKPIAPPYSTYPMMAAAGVRKKANGNYEMYVSPTKKTPLIAHATCVNTSKNRSEFKWTSYDQANSGDLPLGTDANNRFCFLQDVKNIPSPIADKLGTYAHGWAFDDAAHPDSVGFFWLNNNWKLAIKTGIHNYPVNVHVSGVCFNANEDHGLWNYWISESASASYPMSATPGVTCGLHSFSGHFNTETGDWSDGVSISYKRRLLLTGAPSRFVMNLKNGKSAWASCMK